MMHPRKYIPSIVVGTLTFVGLMWVSAKTCKAHLRKRQIKLRKLFRRINDIKQTDKLMHLVNQSLSKGKDVSIAFRYASHQLRRTQIKANVMRAVQINYNPHYAMDTKVQMGLTYLIKHAHDTIFKQYLIKLKSYQKHPEQLKELQKFAKEYHKFTKRVIVKLAKQRD